MTEPSNPLGKALDALEQVPPPEQAIAKGFAVDMSAYKEALMEKRREDWWLAAVQLAAHRADVIFQAGYYQRETPKHTFIKDDDIRYATRQWQEWFYDQIAAGPPAQRQP